MRRQFVRVYLLIFLTVTLLLLGFGEVFDALTDREENYELPASDVFAALSSQPDNFRVVPKGTVQFPPELATRLAQGNVVAVRLASGSITYYQQRNSRLYALGPVPPRSTNTQTINRISFILFYLTLASAFLLVLYPIARDMLRVQRAADQFARTPDVIPTPVKRLSSVYPLAHTLHSMSKRIMELLSTQRDLSNTVAHEIRTPLSRMEFVLQKMESRIENKEYQLMQKDIEEINALVTSYLEFARVEHRGMSDKVRQLPTGLLMDKLGQRFELIPQPVEIHFEYAEQNCGYDPDFMFVAVQNLINNALRYARQTIRVSWRFEDQLSIIQVADDGCGLPAKHQALKDAFKQGSDPAKHFGFGLGLYIVHQIARRHQGELVIGTSETLGGASFEIRWPVTGGLAVNASD